MGVILIVGSFRSFGSTFMRLTFMLLNLKQGEIKAFVKQCSTNLWHISSTYDFLVASILHEFMLCREGFTKLHFLLYNLHSIMYVSITVIFNSYK